MDSATRSGYLVNLAQSTAQPLDLAHVRDPPLSLFFLPVAHLGAWPCAALWASPRAQALNPAARGALCCFHPTHAGVPALRAIPETPRRRIFFIQIPLPLFEDDVAARSFMNGDVFRFDVPESVPPSSLASPFRNLPAGGPLTVFCNPRKGTATVFREACKPEAYHVRGALPGRSFPWRLCALAHRVSGP